MYLGEKYYVMDIMLRLDKTGPFLKPQILQVQINAGSFMPIIIYKRG